MLSVYECAYSPSPLARTTAWLRAIEALNYLAALPSDVAPGPKTDTRSALAIVGKAQSYIADNFRRAFSLADLARHSNANVFCGPARRVCAALRTARKRFSIINL
ncbi:MAG: hypothetical protein GF398_20015 [Chitinivibrionales bacterium]|nr:hypothetical protein [Chitinivibrionales bacterium]